MFLQALEFDELAAVLAADGVNPVHTAALWRALHRDLDPDLRAVERFAPPLRRWIASRLGETVFLEAPAVSVETASTDGLTQKLLLRLDDGQEVETVIMGYPGRYTACLSTQAGCAMGCVFCATGQMGFVRHLRTGEIVAQVQAAQRWLRERGRPALRNLVLMGMGEPLHNYDAAIAALRIISDTRGLNIGPGRMTVSTVGVVPGILRLAEEKQPYHLAVSLHAATDGERSSLVPSNRRWPLPELMEACRIYSGATGRRIIFAWTLIAGQNDGVEQARQVVELLRGQNAHLNLIRLNPTAGFKGETAGDAAAQEFHRIVTTAGIPCTVRQRRGIDVAAGCGQLRAEKSKRVAPSPLAEQRP